MHLESVLNQSKHYTRRLSTTLSLLACVVGVSLTPQVLAEQGREWLAGDHHAHTHWSVKWDKSTSPWSPIKGGDSGHTYLENANAAHKYGLSWLVNTDHGGPEHSKLLNDKAYPELLEARQAVPDVMQFFGIELDVPAGEHATVMVPINASERELLVNFQRDYSIREYRNKTRQRNTVEHLQAGIRSFSELTEKPLIIKNHPSRQATGPNKWARVTPEKLKTWHETDPDVFVGMVAAPGHQAGRNRGSYYKYPTLNGFDQMTASVGGVWDYFLGNGMRFWITAGSDSHVASEAGGRDFWPGQYTKTYVYAQKTSKDIMDGLRHGRSFMVFGDLISGIDVTLQSSANKTASLGETLTVSKSEQPITMKVEVDIPTTVNFNNERPKLNRIDVIVGAVDDSVLSENGNESTNVYRRISSEEWQVVDGKVVFELALPNDFENGYVRLRGTNTDTLEPSIDSWNNEQDPWQDLWFYTNPIFWHSTR